jgi:hypothetical protein
MYIWSAFHSPGSEFGERIYPEVIAVDSGMPAAVAAAYREAERIKQHSNGAYAVMARKVLELVAREHGVQERNLSKAISCLAARGVIPPFLAEAATLIRKFGNISAHSSDQSIDALHVALIEKFLTVLVEYLYVAPTALRELAKMALNIDEDDEKT